MARIMWVVLFVIICMFSCEFDPETVYGASNRKFDAVLKDIRVPERHHTIDFSGDYVFVKVDIKEEELEALYTETVFEGKILKVDGKIALNGISVCDYSNSSINPITFNITTKDGTVKDYKVSVCAINTDSNGFSDNDEFPANCKGLKPGTNLRITEIVFHGDTVDDEYIEIYNPSNEDINLNRSTSSFDEFRLYRMTRFGSLYRIYSFPQNCKIHAGETLRIANSNSNIYLESDYVFDDDIGLIASDEGLILLTVFTCNSGIITDLVVYGEPKDWNIWSKVVVDSSGPLPYSSLNEPVGELGEPVCLTMLWSSDLVAVGSDTRGIRRFDINSDSDSEEDWGLLY